MGKLLDIAVTAAATNRPGCGVGRALKGEHGNDLQTLLEWREAKRLSYPEITALCREVGLDLHPDTLSKHWRGACTCPRSQDPN